MSARSRAFPWWGPRRRPEPEPEPQRPIVNLPAYEDPFSGFRGLYAGQLLGYAVFHTMEPIKGGEGE